MKGKDNWYNTTISGWVNQLLVGYRSVMFCLIPAAADDITCLHMNTHREGGEGGRDGGGGGGGGGNWRLDVTTAPT